MGMYPFEPEIKIYDHSIQKHLPVNMANSKVQLTQILYNNILFGINLSSQ